MQYQHQIPMSYLLVCASVPFLYVVCPVFHVRFGHFLCPEQHVKFSTFPRCTQPPMTPPTQNKCSTHITQHQGGGMRMQSAVSASFCKPWFTKHTHTSHKRARACTHAPMSSMRPCPPCSGGTERTWPSCGWQRGCPGRVLALRSPKAQCRMVLLQLPGIRAAAKARTGGCAARPASQRLWGHICVSHLSVAPSAHRQRRRSQ